MGFLIPHPRIEASSSTAAATDSLYNLNHPRLLFTQQELPSLRAAVRDGGEDDNAYNFIRLFADYIYPFTSYDQLLYGDFGLHTIPNLGLAAYLESPEDTASAALGRDLTLYIANNWDVDTDVYYSSLRLRSLALGYDLFFKNAAAADRDLVRNEMTAYMDSMLTNLCFQIYGLRPYLGNKSVMMAAAVGLAAICLDGEIDPAKVQAALTMADDFTSKWLEYMVDENGSYNEGVLYGGWSLQHLIYYFQARKRYDGFDYASQPKLRNIEKWFAYELLTEGHGKTNNLNDSSYDDYPLSQNNTYLEWGLHEWNSGLCAWLWDHVMGIYGYDFGIFSDKTATVLWHRDLPRVQPGTVLPPGYFWQDRGLYYFRSGWQSGLSSNDVLFSFYCGKYQGGHAQEDQGQFTLYAYGGKFALDNGIGTAAKQTEAHNLVLIDGVGQHNAGSGIGTDGTVKEFLLGGFADYLQGDATSAYTTHSALNNYNYPFIGTDWSWGYDGGNPVNFAIRRVFVVHDSLEPPYFMVIDDIEKDGLSHDYQWRMHTLSTNPIDTTADPVRITSGSAFLDVYALNPPLSQLGMEILPYDNLNADPNTSALAFTVNAVNPRFAFLLLPGDGTTPQPTVTREAFPWGLACTLDWGGGTKDVVIANFSGGEIIYDLAGSSAGGSTLIGPERAPTIPVLTDAAEIVLRTRYGVPYAYTMAHVSVFTFNDTAYVSVANGPLSVSLSGNVINIDRYDADFSFYAPGVDTVFYRGQRISIIKNNGFVTPDPVNSIGDVGPRDIPLRAYAYPNPFNPRTTVVLSLERDAEVSAVVYDVLGRRVARLWNGKMRRGVNTIQWKGLNDRGEQVGSGVYVMKIEAGGVVRTLKLELVK